MAEPATARASGLRPFHVLVALPFLVFAALAGLFAFRLLAGGDPSRLPSVLVGRNAPPLDLPPLADLRDREGRPVPGLSRAELAKPGHVTVVNVWASWCGPCRVEHPRLAEIAADSGVRVIGINYKDKPDAARRFLAALGNPYAAVGADETGRTAIEWGVYGVPETFVVGPDGIVRFKHVGPLSPDDMPKLRAAISAAARPEGS